jgi:hypothetical protein
MRRLGILLATSLLTMLSIMPIAAQTASQAGEVYQAQSSVIGGPGVQALQIEGQPDANGLVWDIREPERSFEAWTVVVHNAGDAPVTNIVATLEIMVDGQWYLANLDADEGLILPPVIQPGEFGFDRMGDIGAAPDPWTDSRIVVESINEPREQELVNLGLRDVGIRGTQMYVGTFVNDSSFPVTDLVLYVGCVEDGRLVDTFFFVSDLLRLAPGDEEPFELSDTFRSCEPSAEQFVTAIAVRI